MYKLKNTVAGEENLAMDIINQAKAFLKEQGIDQWQTGYPNMEAILGDIEKQRGYFFLENDVIFGYACIDYEGEAKESRGKGLADVAFRLVAEQAKSKGIENFRVDTDEANKIMQAVLKRNGFTYCGVIWFDNSEKIAFEKKI